MKNKVDIDILGGEFRDIIFYGNDIHSDNFLEVPGGTGYNVFIGLLRLGFSVKFHGKVGNDWPFELFTVRDEKEKSGIFVSRNEKTILGVYRGANLTVEYSPLQSSILFSTLECGGGIFKIYASSVKKEGGLVVLDPSPITEWRPEYLKMCDILLPDEEEYNVILSSTTQTEMGSKCFFIKKGRNGAIYMEGNVAKYLVFTEPGGKHTLGCGDAFDVVVLYGLLKQVQKDKVLELANNAGRRASFIKGSSTAVEEAICTVLNCRK